MLFFSKRDSHHMKMWHPLDYLIFLMKNCFDFETWPWFLVLPDHQQLWHSLCLINGPGSSLEIISSTIRSPLIRHRSDTFTLDQHLIDIDPLVYAIGAVPYQCQGKYANTFFFTFPQNNSVYKELTQLTVLGTVFMVTWVTLTWIMELLN